MIVFFVFFFVCTVPMATIFICRQEKGSKLGFYSPYFTMYNSYMHNLYQIIRFSRWAVNDIHIIIFS